MSFDLELWQTKISEFFNNQEGQPYPCSNQNVTNGFFTEDESKWKEFLESNKNKITELRKDSVVFNNKERWHYYHHFSEEGHVRGFRFYKIKVDKTINKEFLMRCVLPCCAHYCCEFEWI